MNAEALFTAALQLGPEWKVVRLEVDHPGRELTLHLDFVPGSRFAAPEALTNSCAGARHGGALLAPPQLLAGSHHPHGAGADSPVHQPPYSLPPPRRVQTPAGKVVQVEVAG